MMTPIEKLENCLVRMGFAFDSKIEKDNMSDQFITTFVFEGVF